MGVIMAAPLPKEGLAIVVDGEDDREAITHAEWRSGESERWLPGYTILSRPSSPPFSRS